MNTLKDLIKEEQNYFNNQYSISKQNKKKPGCRCINFSEKNNYFHIVISGNNQSINTYYLSIPQPNYNEIDLNEQSKLMNHTYDRNTIFVVPDFSINQQSLNSLDFTTYTISEFSNYLIKQCTKGLNKNKVSNVIGTFGEIKIANALRNSNNIKIWNGNEDISHSYNYPIFKSVATSAFKASNKDKASITTVTDVACGSEQFPVNNYHLHQRKLLQKDNKGGKPKTDVYANIITINDDKIPAKISAKYPLDPNKPTSVHQGTAFDLINSMMHSNDLDNTIFHGKSTKSLSLNAFDVALTDFQIHGNEGYMTYDNAKTFNKAVNDNGFKAWLIKFFMFGIDNYAQHGVQKANMITEFNISNGNIYSLDLNNVTKKELDWSNGNNTKNNKPKKIFHWTYQGTRGLSFQVKMQLPFTF